MVESTDSSRNTEQLLKRPQNELRFSRCLALPLPVFEEVATVRKRKYDIIARVYLASGDMLDQMFTVQVLDPCQDILLMFKTLLIVQLLDSDLKQIGP